MTIREMVRLMLERMGEDVWYSTQNEGPLVCPECLYEF